jgi:predicted nucleotidyltransferase
MNNLDLIKSIIKEFIPASTIYLFGSQAKNLQRDDSDYDILAITNVELSLESKLYYQSIIRKALAKHRLDIDIIVENKNDVDQKVKLPGHIIQIAMEEGVVI